VNNWVSRGIHQEDKKQIISLEQKKLNDYDYIALIWWAVNMAITRNNIMQHKRFRIVHYNDLVRNQAVELKKIYDFLGIEYRKSRLKFHDKSIGKGQNICLEPSVDAMCSQLQNDLIGFVAEAKEYKNFL
jgi:hypothetical protein